MRKEELIKQLQARDSLLANAVSHMVTYVQDHYPSTFPSKEQTEAVNNYLRSVHADGDGSMSERNCEHPWRSQLPGTLISAHPPV